MTRTAGASASSAVQPPQQRRGDLDQIEFVVREDLPS
jgi:hypothetical protein